jgi:hypothetical protein
VGGGGRWACEGGLGTTTVLGSARGKCESESADSWVTWYRSEGWRYRETGVQIAMLGVDIVHFGGGNSTAQHSNVKAKAKAR